MTIAELISTHGGSIKTGPFGTALKASEYADEGVPLISVREIGHGEFHVDHKTPRVGPTTLVRLPEYILQKGDIVFARKGGIERCALVREREVGWFLGSDGIRLRPPSSCDARFLAYSLQTKATKDWLLQHSTGSTMASLNGATIGRLPIVLPSLYEQNIVADVLEAFDDRIALLRETNATLEAIAHALFKSWFVDFDPVRAKIAGRAPEGMDEATAALFPDALEETELGLVPKGWQFGTVGDIARLKKGTVNPGSQPNVMFEHFSLPAFDSGCRPVVEPGEAIKSNKTPVPSDAVLLSKLNPHIPRVWLPVSCGSNAVCSTEFLVFQPVGAGSKELIYCAFSSPDFILRLQQLVTGTSNSHQRIKPDQVALMSCVVPPKDIASHFELSMRPIFERVHANREQAQTLASLRDALLPRLISGQLQLPEVADAN